MGELSSHNHARSMQWLCWTERRLDLLQLLMLRRRYVKAPQFGKWSVKVWRVTVLPRKLRCPLKNQELEDKFRFEMAFLSGYVGFSWEVYVFFVSTWPSGKPSKKWCCNRSWPANILGYASKFWRCKRGNSKLRMVSQFQDLKWSELLELENPKNRWNL